MAKKRNRSPRRSVAVRPAPVQAGLDKAWLADLVEEYSPAAVEALVRAVQKFAPQLLAQLVAYLRQPRVVGAPVGAPHPFLVDMILRLLKGQVANEKVRALIDQYGAAALAFLFELLGKIKRT